MTSGESATIHGARRHWQGNLQGGNWECREGNRIRPFLQMTRAHRRVKSCRRHRSARQKERQKTAELIVKLSVVAEAGVDRKHWDDSVSGGDLHTDRDGEARLI